MYYVMKIFLRDYKPIYFDYRDGAGELLEGLSRLKGLTTAIQDALLAQAPDLVKPM